MGAGLRTTWSPPAGVEESDDWVLMEGELAFDGFVSMSKMGEEGGGSKRGCAMCRRTSSNRNSRSNYELKIVTAKGW